MRPVFTVYTRRLSTILKDVRLGDLLIPEMTPHKPWSLKQVLLLLDSISRGLPIGSLLTWRTRNGMLPVRASWGGTKLVVREEMERGREYLLDGKERVASLLYALHVVGFVYYDLIADPSEVAVQNASEQQIPPASWLPIPLLFNPMELSEHQSLLVQHGMEEEATKAEQLANAFRDYPVTITTLVTEDEKIALELQKRMG